jgi:Protein of unknown function (DUF3622)
MAKAKKFDCRVVKDGTGWAAEIVRRKTSKELLVSKRQGGFATEAEAQEWGQKALESFLLSLKERNKRRAQ